MNTTEKDIVIIGAGLTGLTLAFYLKKAGKNVLILEKSDRTGGVINSVTENGFTYETGPSTGVLSTLEIAALFEDLQGKCKLETANKQAQKRYIWKKDRWEALPSGLLSAVKTPLFTLYDKLRILGEPWRKKGGNPDESVAELVVRRLGKSFLDYAVDPFLSGVYAGDPYKLITRYALPKLYALEFEHGGFIRGTIAKHKGVKLNQPHSKAHKVTREVFSVQGGFKNLIDALTAEVGPENIQLGCKQTLINPDSNGFCTTFVDSSGLLKKAESAKVVTTIGGYALPDVLPFVDSQLMFHLTQTNYAPVIQIAVGYYKWTGIKLDAFGGLVSSKDKRNVLGVLFPSAIFSERAPQGGALLSVFMGGVKRAELLQLSDEELTQIVCEELKITMKIDVMPDLIRIHRYQHAIAQYDIKSESRFAAIAAIEQKYPGLILAGSLRDGIGMADRVKQAKLIAEQLKKK